jgi:hypothetical protein
VDVAGDEVFAYATLARDEHLALGGGHTRRGREEGGHLGIGNDNSTRIKRVHWTQTIT